MKTYLNLIFWVSPYLPIQILGAFIFGLLMPVGTGDLKKELLLMHINLIWIRVVNLDKELTGAMN